MKRCMVILTVAGLALAGTGNTERWAVGLRIPISKEIEVMSNSSEVRTDENWVGLLGTFEFYAHRTVGIELVGGYYLALSGKTEVDEVEIGKFKRSMMIPFAVFLKYYIPMAEGSKLHPYIACGPRVSVESYSVKVNDDYEDAGSFTRFSLCHDCVLSCGLDFDIAENVKLGGVLDFNVNHVSWNPETQYEQALPEESTTHVRLGAGLVCRYTF